MPPPELAETTLRCSVKYAFDHGKIRIDELANPDRTLHIDSKVLETAEAQEEAVSLAHNGSDDDNDGGDDHAKREIVTSRYYEIPADPIKGE